MSNLRPSFYTLYRQARPSTLPGQKTMEQHERFATACIAFALHHDENFRRDFLDKICGYKGPLRAEAFKVSLEIENSGDLALSTTNETFLIEAKINARLQDKQNPSKEAFFETGGYGRHIIDCYPGNKTYIVLWQQEGANASSRKELRCIAKRWDTLFSINSKKNPIIEDLFQSLGSLQVRCFSILNPMTDKLNLAKHADWACQVHAVLDDVADYLKESLGLPSRSDDSVFQPGGGSFIGWDITAKKAHRKWIELISPKAGKNDAITWFGYNDGKLNVGFYCGPDKLADAQTLLKKCAATSEKVRRDKDYVWIEHEGGPAKGDKEWFRAIYDGMNAHAAEAMNLSGRKTRRLPKRR